MTPNEVFVDTGGWVALSIETDAYHRRAIETFGRIVGDDRRMLTTNLVVAESYETIRRIGGSHVALRFLHSTRGSARLLKVYSDASFEEQAEATLRRFDDQRFSFVDAVSFAVMSDRRIAEAFSFDHHFETAGFRLVSLSRG